MPRASVRTATVLAALVLAAGCSSTAAAPHTSVHSAAPAGSQPADDGIHAAPSAPAANAALYAAQTYIRLWARPALNQHAWYAAIRPWVTPAYGQLLASTDPANVPAHGVTGPPRPVSSTPTVVVADIPTDAGPVRVTVLNTGGRWLVATARPATAP